jgi:outer membrane protein assembly factor BamB
VTKILKYILLLLVISGCSLNDTTGFWSKEKNLKKLSKFKSVFQNDEVLSKEFNNNFILAIDPLTINYNEESNLDNNDSYKKYIGNLKKISKYNFSKIDNYEQIEPEPIFFKDNVIFFDNKGTILSFDHSSKLIWKRNIYSKNEKKINPLLSMNKMSEKLVVTDNLSNYYALNIKDGSILWSKKHTTPFNSQIKIFKNLFFVVDSNNNLICYSIEDGKKIWSFKTEKPFINSLKKLSIVIKQNLVIFNNSLGDITALNIESGMLEWQISTQNSENFSELMNLKTSDLIIESDSIYFSNNKNNFYSLDLKTGSINWIQKISSHIKPAIIGNLVFAISEDGYFFVIEKNSGNIVRINNIFKEFNKNKLITPTGFIFNFKEIFITTNNGRLFIIDLKSGLIKSVMKIDNKKISRPFVKDNYMYLIKDNSIIKLN